jgi:hypothetical protein
LDLIVTLDDATSEVYSGFLVEEGAFSSFRGLAETIGRQGLFCSLYTDRGSHDFFTPEAGTSRHRSRYRPDGSLIGEEATTRSAA